MILFIQELEYHAGKLRLDLNLKLDGRIAGIFGISGAGKTTLLELIAGFRKAAKGKIQFGDKVLVDVSRKIFIPAFRRNIGYVPQDLALFPHLSVKANLDYGTGNKQSVISFDEVVRILELNSLLNRNIDRLSGGEKQRVAFGRALLACPELLLMDEPLSNLNVELKQRIRELILWIRDKPKIPILYVSHDADDMVTLCDSVVVLENGRNILTGAPQNLFETDTTTHFRVKSNDTRNSI
jgi:molybdate transport system ATP-binding protein